MDTNALEISAEAKAQHIANFLAAHPGLDAPAHAAQLSILGESLATIDAINALYGGNLPLTRGEDGRGMKISVLETLKETAIKRADRAAAALERVRPTTGGTLANPSKILVNQKTLAKLTGFTASWISQFIKANALKPDKDGLFDAFEVVPLLHTKNSTARLETAKVEKAEAEAAIAQKELAKMNGDLVDPAECALAIRTAYAPTAAAIRTFPRKLAAQILNIGTIPEAMEILTKETEKWQTQLKANISKALKGKS